MIYRLTESLWLDVKQTLHTFGACTYTHDAHPPVTVIEVHRFIDLLSRLDVAQRVAEVDFGVPSEAGDWLANGQHMANAFQWGDHRVLVLAPEVVLDRDVPEPDPPVFEVWHAHFAGTA